MIHQLKILPKFFEKVISGEKPFEVRNNDRNFKVGDYLALNEFANGDYTGRSCVVYVDYILENFPLVVPNAVVMAIKPCKVSKTQEGYDTFAPAPVLWNAVPIIEEPKIQPKDSGNEGRNMEDIENAR